MRFIAMLTFVLALPASSWAYVPSITNVTQKPLRWANTTCIQLVPDLNGSSDIADGSDLEAINRSVQNWHSAISLCSYIHFDVLPGRAGLIRGFNQKGANESVVTWIESGWSPARDGQAAGLTTLFFVDDADSPRDGMILDADVELNGVNFVFSTQEGGEGGKMDVENTLTHELGHVLGLDHPCDDGSREVLPRDNLGNALPKCGSSGVTRTMRETTMYNFASTGETSKRTPEQDDILGVCETYPISSDPGECRPPIAGSSGGCNVVTEGEPAATEGLGLALLFGLLVVVIAGRLGRRQGFPERY